MSSFERGVSEGKRRPEGEVVSETLTEDHSQTAAKGRVRERSHGITAGVSSSHLPSSPCCFHHVSVRSEE